jgi:hypothetical protein
VNPRILFVLKYHDNTPEVYGCLSSGLFNSATFVNDMLVKSGVESKLVQLAENTDIDREVFNYKPTHVIVEALWVVPEKIKELTLLHPDVTWIIRCHSDVAFIAQEGIAVNWISEYLKLSNVFVAFNAPESVEDFKYLTSHKNHHKVIYLPNYYPVTKAHKNSSKDSGDWIDIGCFGAIRPLKNQMVQAMAAIKYAKIKGKKLRFHMNGTRPEQGGDNILKNIRALFKNTENVLIEHPWMLHHEFVELLKTIQVSLNVSFSETFNIVAADSVVAGVITIASKEVPWINAKCHAEPNDLDDIVTKMLRATDWRLSKVLRWLNLQGLKNYAENSKKIWLHWLGLPY